MTGRRRSSIKEAVRIMHLTNQINFRNAHPLMIFGKVAGVSVELLIDSGSCLTIINKQLFSQLPLCFRRRVQLLQSSLSFKLPNKSGLKIKYVLPLPITISNCIRYHTVYVVPLLWQLCIIGNDFIRMHDLQIDGKRQTAYFRI